MLLTTMVVEVEAAEFIGRSPDERRAVDLPQRLETTEGGYGAKGPVPQPRAGIEQDLVHLHGCLCGLLPKGCHWRLVRQCRTGRQAACGIRTGKPTKQRVTMH